MSQISIVKLSEVEKDGRFDAEFYKPEYLLQERRLHKLSQILLKEIAKITDGQHGYFITDEKSDIRQFTSKHIINGFIEGQDADRLSVLTHNQNLRSSLKEEDVLLTTVGTVGNSGLVFEENLPANIDQNLARIFIKDKKRLNPFYLSIFLSCKYGQSIIKKNITGQVQQRISLFNLSNFLIPLLPQSFQKKIETLVKDSYLKLQKSKTLYKEAEEILLKELGLLNYKPKHELTFSSNLKEVIDAERFDADYFQPKYNEIGKRIEEYKGGFDLVRSQFKQNKKLSKKKEGFYNYIEIGDINISNGDINFTKKPLEEIPDNGKIKLEKKDLLISKVRPYRGAVSFIDFDKDNLLGSGAFTVLQEKTNYKKEVLMVFLRTIFIKDFLLRFNCGTSYPVIKDEDILNLKIPLLPSQIQNKISSKIQESFKLRKESKGLLEKAKKEVEERIEKEAKR